ncbi:PREDICTED: zinc finger protein ZIC 5-like [Vollenhovia emeryi]|uniref:zinc finger protein ZIC 5-like n=1 Tax=Vollenhovia emeryi TaxID=411798 RepID=UPI0005F537D0|nr:PREDICTED: zinc finger protein ZIC 5-like [Vollenhovia emeryi]
MGKLRARLEKMAPRRRAPGHPPIPGLTPQAPRYVPPVEARPRTARASVSVEQRGQAPAVIRARTTVSRQEQLYQAAAQTTAALASELDALFGSLSDLEDEPMATTEPARTATVAATPELPTPPPTPAATPEPVPVTSPTAGPPPGYGYFTGDNGDGFNGLLRDVPWHRIRPGQRYRHHTAGRTIIVKRLRNGEIQLRERT